MKDTREKLKRIERDEGYKREIKENREMKDTREKLKRIERDEGYKREIKENRERWMIQDRN